jgi:hypothetical protein
MLRPPAGAGQLCPAVRVGSAAGRVASEAVLEDRAEQDTELSGEAEAAGSIHRGVHRARGVPGPWPGCPAHGPQLALSADPVQAGLASVRRGLSLPEAFGQGRGESRLDGRFGVD